MDNKTIIASIIAILIIVVAICLYFVLYNPEPGDREVEGSKQIPYYFIAVHNEPCCAGERYYNALKQLVEYANNYNMKLTLMFSPQWADFILSDPKRKAEFEEWKKQGHEIAAHHHSIYHPGSWDGYSYLPEDEAIKIRQEYYEENYGNYPPPREPPYLGNVSDFIAALKKLNPDMKSGCMNDEIDKNVFPDEIIYDTCSGYTTYGEPVKDQAGGGRNEFILSGTVNGIERKWISHKKVTNNAEEKASEKLFNSINSGVYGAVTHSNPDQATDMMRFMDFIHEKDPTGEKSRTVSEIINQKLLPEKYINPY